MEDALFQGLIGLTVGLFFGLLIYGPKYINKNIHQSRAKTGNINSKFYLAKYFVEKKKYEPAIQYLNEVLSQNPNLYEPAELLALCYYATEEFNSAIPLFERLIEEKPRNAQYLFFLGNCFYKSNNLAKATEYREKAIQLDRKYIKVEFKSFNPSNYRINKLIIGFLLLAILVIVAYLILGNKRNSLSLSQKANISIQDIELITDSMRYEQALDLKGLGDLHIDRTTLSIIDKIKKDSRYSKETIQVQQRSFFDDFLDHSKYIPPNVSQAKNSGYNCPDIKLYNIGKYYIGESIVFDLKLLFYRDTLIRINCYRTDKIDSAFVYKYGEGLKEFHTDSMLNRAGVLQKTNISKIKWENRNVSAFFIKKVFDPPMGAYSSDPRLEITSKSDKWLQIKECERKFEDAHKKELEQKRIKELMQF